MSTRIGVEAGGLALEVSGYLRANGDLVLIVDIGGEHCLRIHLEEIVTEDRRLVLPDCGATIRMRLGRQSG